MGITGRSKENGIKIKKYTIDLDEGEIKTLMACLVEVQKRVGGIFFPLSLERIKELDRDELENLWFRLNRLTK